MVMQGGQEVRVDSEDKGSTEELYATDDPLEELEGEARFGAHDEGWVQWEESGRERWSRLGVGVR